MGDDHMGYWQELPYRGEPPYKEPQPKPPKRVRTKKERWRDGIISALIIIIFLAFVSCLIIFDPNHPSDQNWKILLVFLVSFLLMIGFGFGINALNKRLRGDDLDTPGYSDEKESDKE
jgi:hypothetical protein